MGTILIYKLVADDNGAPCVTNYLLTLAICKPGYRHVAQAGDFLFGFMGRGVTADATEPLVYLAEVTEPPMPIKEYYSLKAYSTRPDCIYALRNGEYVIRKNARYHTEQDRRNKDLGSKRNAKVLLSRNFRYFGNKAQSIDPVRYPELTSLVHSLGQTNYPPSKKVSSRTVNECEELIGQKWLQYKSMKNGEATHPQGSFDCGKGSIPICIKAK